MHTTYKCLFVVLAMSCSFFANGQILPKDAYREGSREQNQVQRLINGSVSYAENMLVKQGAYTPYAAALTYTDSVVIIDPADTKGKTLIHAVEDLKALLKAGADKDQYKAVVVLFDVTVTDPTTQQPTDAIAAFTEQVNTIGAYTFYFPYKKSEPQGLSQSRSFDGLSDNEIFTKVSKN